ncbi:hypothetical protein M427DRAFT_335079 [Gonapodya prolifera JEL478]|uniref:Uncharacterized protein n=1 Tax=Gonapodya prolifera (strain JEL478) TaxID=1344416 RepID=A0A139ADJ4_GONPJ|nr:hypothetical protein M427DRAFT_335079 [Gonapodya prolifera JEL478]|eukprot:KXS14840.1 hypothetical protein M427DRAFT_335079 [Gonapodya prolifera JEL478]
MRSAEAILLGERQTIKHLRATHLVLDGAPISMLYLFPDLRYYEGSCKEVVPSTFTTSNSRGRRHEHLESLDMCSIDRLHDDAVADLSAAIRSGCFPRLREIRVTSHPAPELEPGTNVEELDDAYALDIDLCAPTVLALLKLVDECPDISVSVICDNERMEKAFRLLYIKDDTPRRLRVSTFRQAPLTTLESPLGGGISVVDMFDVWPGQRYR